MNLESEFFDNAPTQKPKECGNCSGIQPNRVAGQWSCGVVIAARVIKIVSTVNAPANWQYHGINLDQIPPSCPKNITKEELLRLPVRSE